MSPAAEQAVAEFEAKQLAQRRKALQRANAVRTHRRYLKEDMAVAKVRLADIFTEPVDDRLDSAVVIDLLRAIPAVGKVKALAWIREAKLTPTTTVVKTTERQRLLLVALANSHERSSQVWRRYRSKAMAA